MLQKYLNKNKFNLGPFLPCKAALKHACEAQTWGFYWKLPWRGGWGCKAWEKRWNQGERKISACTWAANRHKSLAVFLLQGMTVCWNRKQQQLFAGSLNTNTKHSGIRNCLSAALLTCQGKNWGQYKADFTVSTCPEEEKKKKKGISQAAGLTACWSVLQHSTEHFHPAYILLTAPFPSRGGNASSGPQIALVNWCWIPAVQQDKPTTVNRQSLPFGKAKTVNLFQLLHFLLSFHCEIKQYLEPWFLYNLENHLDKAMLW